MSNNKKFNPLNSKGFRGIPPHFKEIKKKMEGDDAQ